MLNKFARRCTDNTIFQDKHFFVYYSSFGSLNIDLSACAVSVFEINKFLISTIGKIGPIECFNELNLNLYNCLACYVKDIECYEHDLIFCCKDGQKNYVKEKRNFIINIDEMLSYVTFKRDQRGHKNKYGTWVAKNALTISNLNVTFYLEYVFCDNITFKIKQYEINNMNIKSVYKDKNIDKILGFSLFYDCESKKESKEKKVRYINTMKVTDMRLFNLKFFQIRDVRLYYKDFVMTEEIFRKISELVQNMRLFHVFNFFGVYIETNFKNISYDTRIIFDVPKTQSFEFKSTIDLPLVHFVFQMKTGPEKFEYSNVYIENKRSSFNGPVNIDNLIVKGIEILTDNQWLRHTVTKRMNELKNQKFFKNAKKKMNKLEMLGIIMAYDTLEYIINHEDKHKLNVNDFTFCFTGPKLDFDSMLKDHEIKLQQLKDPKEQLDKKDMKEIVIDLKNFSKIKSFDFYTLVPYRVKILNFRRRNIYVKSGQNVKEVCSSINRIFNYINEVNDVMDERFEDSERKDIEHEYFLDFEICNDWFLFEKKNTELQYKKFKLNK